MPDRLMDIAAEIELHATHLDMTKAVLSSLCDTLENLYTEVKQGIQGAANPERLQRIENLAYVVNEMLNQQHSVAADIAQKCYDAAQSARAA